MSKKPKKPKIQKTKVAGDTVKTVKITAQDTIPFAEMYENGMILNQRIKGKETYSLTFSMQNTNYLMLKDEDKIKKLDGYIQPLNSLPEDISYQELLITVPLETQSLQDTMAGEQLPTDTDYDETYIENQHHFLKEIKESETETKRYISLSYETKSKSENPFNILMQQYTKLSVAFSEIGVVTELLTPEQRLELFHNIYNPFEYGNFQLPENMYLKGTDISDYIAPSVFDFKVNSLIMGGTFSRVFFVRSFAEVIDDAFINELTENDFSTVVSKHIKLVSKGLAEKLVGDRLRALEGSNQTRKKKNAQSGTDYIPYDLKKNIEACEELLDSLNNEQELFEVGIYILLSSPSKEALENDTKAIRGICQRHHVAVSPVTIRQEEALNCILPLAQDYLTLNQYLLSSGVAHLLPFSYDRVFSPTGFYYGKNTVSKAPIIIDRKKDKNGNGFYLGKSGSGKSMYGKMEIEDVWYQTKDKIIVVDPEREFVGQCRQHNGSVIQISANAKNYINPFDVFGDQSENDDIIKTKAALITSLFEVFKNAKLDPKEKTIIDRCVKLVYAPCVKSGWKREKIPTFKEFDKILLKQPETVICNDLHLYLEMYITGTVDIFAHKTSVDMTNRYIDFDLRDLGENLKKAGMLIVIDFIQQQVFDNFDKGIWTWLYVDEFQTFYDDESEISSSAVFFEKMFARFRKYGGIATGLTQNITNVLRSHTSISMLQNSQFVVLLEQATNNLEQIRRIYDLSDKQAAKLMNTRRGEGMLVTQNTVYPFEKIYPNNNLIYNTITTSFADRISMMEQNQSAS